MCEDVEYNGCRYNVWDPLKRKKPKRWLTRKNIWWNAEELAKSRLIPKSVGISILTQRLSLGLHERADDGPESKKVNSFSDEVFVKEAYGKKKVMP